MRQYFESGIFGLAITLFAINVAAGYSITITKPTGNIKTNKDFIVEVAYSHAETQACGSDGANFPIIGYLAYQIDNGQKTRFGPYDIHLDEKSGTANMGISIGSYSNYSVHSLTVHFVDCSWISRSSDTIIFSRCDACGTCYDNDRDGYYFASLECLSGYGDCNDANPNIHPNAPEVCDGVDNNCNGQIDEGFNSDSDGDGHYTVGSCLQPADDCADNDSTVYTGALELCDGKDNNCNGVIDEGCGCIHGTTRPCYEGPSGTENVGACRSGTQSCVYGFWENSCRNQILPQPEMCDGIDNDCNLLVDDNINDPCCVDACCNQPDQCPPCGGGGSGQGIGESASSIGKGGIAGHPINLLTGAETLQRTDFTIGSHYPITIQRQYNSRSTYDSPIGYGWALNYDKRLYTYSDGSLTLRKECGWKRRFIPSGSGYTTPAGESGALVKNADGSYTYTLTTGDKEIYDDKGRLAYLVNSKGNSLVFTYGGNNRDPLWGLLPLNIDQSTPIIVSYDYRLSRIDEKDASGSATGKWIEFQYDNSTGRLIKIWDNLGRAVDYAHDGIGNLKGVTGPKMNSSYEYKSSVNKHYITSTVEGHGPYMSDYDSQGRVFYQTHNNGNMGVEYLDPFKKTRVNVFVRDSDGNVTSSGSRIVEFDSNGQVSRETDDSGNVTVYTRDGNMKITREEYWENVVTGSTSTLILKTAYDFTYDSKGNMLSKTEAAGTAIQKTVKYTYDPVYNVVTSETASSVVNPLSYMTTSNLYNTNGTLRSSVRTGLLGDGSPFNYTTMYEYNTNGQITKIDGPRTDVQDVTIYTYDNSTGFLTSMTQPLIGTTTYSNHDGLGNPRTVTDPNGNSTTYTYDDIGRVLTITSPGDTKSSTFGYYLGTNYIWYIILPEGTKIYYDYDGYRNLVKIRDYAGNSINYTYDSEGNRLTEEIRDSLGVLQKTLSFQYDVLNRLKKVINPDNSYTEYGYDFRGNRASLRTPNSQLTTYEYDALNRLVKVIQPGTITTAYGYDTSNNLISVKDANNNTTTYKYDDMGRVYKVVSPDTGTTTYQYDPAGNMISKTDAKGITINYSYDALNRLTLVNFPTDTDIVYAYDNCVNGKGRLCSMTDDSGTTSYEYTQKGQVKKETRLIDGVTYVTQYTYDQNGNLKTMTYPSTRVITYIYDYNGNDTVSYVLNNGNPIASNISYVPYGGEKLIYYDDNTFSEFTYNYLYHMRTYRNAGLINLTYDYDYNGNITRIADGLNLTNKEYHYAALDRLYSATGPWSSLTWTYDGVGNRLTEGTTSYTYQPNTNKLNTVGSVSYGYDNNGNTTGEGARAFIYNDNQRLIRVVDGSTTKGEYTYNGNGQRVKKVVSGVTTIYHYDQQGRLIAESSKTGSITAEYVYLNGRPLAKIDGADTYYYHNDHLGTPIKITDRSRVVWSADYKPFGEATITVSTITNNLGFPGQYRDAETGLLYNLNRVYNSSLGRYNEVDPTGIEQGTNHLYAYARGNPNRYVDPLGLWTCPTSRTYRACDPCGCGNYGSGRGNRTHAGSDVCAQDGDTVSSPLSGTVESIDDGIRITGRVNGVMYSVRIMHFTPSTTSGQVAEGASLGTMGNMTSQYNCNGMTNHVHVEIYQVQGGTTTRIDPTTVLPCGR